MTKSETKDRKSLKESGEQASDSTTVTPRFRLIFFSVLGMTISCLAAVIIIDIAVPNPSDQTKQLADSLLTIVKMGFGAIIGLLGGKAGG